MAAAPTILRNRGPDTVGYGLRRLFDNAERCEIGVAFATVGGVRVLQAALPARARVRVLVGLYQGITEPAALKRLRAFASVSRGRIQARIAKPARFHWKLYMAERRRSSRALIGSANLTESGLHDEGELALVLPLAQEPARRLRGAFDDEWRRGRELTAEGIAAYARQRAPRPKGRTPAPSTLFPPASAVDGTHMPKPPRRAFHRVSVHGFVSRATEIIVERKTGWERKGWYLLGGFEEKSFHPKDRAVLLCSHQDRVELVEFTDVAVTDRTPDGRVFHAYRRLPSTRWRRLSTVWPELKESFGARSRRLGYQHRRLGPKKWETVRKLFL